MCVCVCVLLCGVYCFSSVVVFCLWACNMCVSELNCVDFFWGGAPPPKKSIHNLIWGGGGGCCVLNAFVVDVLWLYTVHLAYAILCKVLRITLRQGAVEVCSLLSSVLFCLVYCSRSQNNSFNYLLLVCLRIVCVCVCVYCNMLNSKQ